MGVSNKIHQVQEFFTSWIYLLPHFTMCQFNRKKLMLKQLTLSLPRSFVCCMPFVGDCRKWQQLQFLFAGNKSFPLNFPFLLPLNLSFPFRFFLSLTAVSFSLIVVVSVFLRWEKVYKYMNREKGRGDSLSLFLHQFSDSLLFSGLLLEWSPIFLQRVHATGKGCVNLGERPEFRLAPRVYRNRS